MRVPWPLLTLLLFAPTALALDGAFEVNQTCALAGCFPGDAPGFPVSLPDPGHYVLTSDLVHDPATHGNVALVVVSADDVTLDLNGFGLRSTSTCLSGACPAGAVQGIIGAGADRVSVFGGRITGVDANCIWLGEQAQVHEMTLSHCALHGVTVGAFSAVRTSTIVSTGRNGISSVVGTTYEHCTLAQNGLRNDIFLPDLTSSVSMQPRATAANYCEDDLCGDGRPRYYLSLIHFPGDSVLTACDPGFHMASRAELLDSSGLQYDVRRGRTNADDGAGPLSGSGGWVRSATGNAVAESCTIWTSAAGAEDGTAALLDTSLTPPDWRTQLVPCSSTNSVWCMED